VWGGGVVAATAVRPHPPHPPGAPSVKDVRIEGEAFALQTLWVSYKYIGAGPVAPFTLYRARGFPVVDILTSLSSHVSISLRTLNKCFFCTPSRKSRHSRSPEVTTHVAKKVK